MSESRVISRIRKPQPLRLYRCAECGESYKRHRIFRDPDDRRQKCFPSCWKNAEDTRLLESIPDVQSESWQKPQQYVKDWLE